MKAGVETRNMAKKRKAEEEERALLEYLKYCYMNALQNLIEMKSSKIVDLVLGKPAPAKIDESDYDALYAESLQAGMDATFLSMMGRVKKIKSMFSSSFIPFQLTIEDYKILYFIAKRSKISELASVLANMIHSLQMEPLLPHLSKLQHGPSNKNLSTQMLESIAKAIIHNPTEVTLFITEINNNDCLMAKIEDKTINVSILLTTGNLNHFKLDENDSRVWFDHNSALKPCNTKIPDSKVLEPLTEAENLAIKSWTWQHSCNNINGMLYNNLRQIPKKDLVNTFMTIAFMSSGLNKIVPETEQIKPTYRGDGKAPAEAIKKRMELIDNGINITAHSGFVSTSSRRDKARRFQNDDKKPKDKNVMIVFDCPYGKSIDDFNWYSENEYLLSPGQILWSKYEEESNEKNHKSTIVFHGLPIDPLLPEKDEVTPEKIRMGKFLYTFLTQHQVDISFMTDHTKKTLGLLPENDSIISPVVNNHKRKR